MWWESKKVRKLRGELLALHGRLELERHTLGLVRKSNSELMYSCITHAQEMSQLKEQLYMQEKNYKTLAEAARSRDIITVEVTCLN